MKFQSLCYAFSLIAIMTLVGCGGGEKSPEEQAERDAALEAELQENLDAEQARFDANKKQ